MYEILYRDCPSCSNGFGHHQPAALHRILKYLFLSRTAPPVSLSTQRLWCHLCLDTFYSLYLIQAYTLKDKHKILHYYSFKSFFYLFYLLIFWKYKSTFPKFIISRKTHIIKTMCPNIHPCSNITL